MRVVGVDLGYGFVKAVAEDGRSVMFPSVVGSARDLSLYGAVAAAGGRRALGHRVRVDEEERFVGELALMESPDAARPFGQEKFDHPATRFLLAAAVALVAGGDGPVHLATGLPLRHYAAQRDAMRASLRGLRMVVELVPGPSAARAEILIEDVTVFPQGAGALFGEILAAGAGRSGDRILLRPSGLLACVDIGYRTTDVCVLDVGAGFALVNRLSDTLDIGMAQVAEAIRERLSVESGRGVPLRAVEAALDGSGAAFWWRGREYDLEELARPALSRTAAAVADALSRLWGDDADRVRRVLLAGGGGERLGPWLTGRLPGVSAFRNAQTANARGFLAVALDRLRRARI